MSQNVQALLYLLMRDELTCGVLESRVQEVENIVDPIFSNKFLADYAEELTERLTKNVTKYDPSTG